MINTDIRLLVYSKNENFTEVYERVTLDFDQNAIDVLAKRIVEVMGEKWRPILEDHIVGTCNTCGLYWESSDGYLVMAKITQNDADISSNAYLMLLNKIRSINEYRNN